MIDYLVGVDGGGSGTRALLLRRDGSVLGHGQAGPSALGQGRPQAWVEIHRAVDAAVAAARLDGFESARCALGLGLSGVHNVGWCAEFLALQKTCAAQRVYGRVELFTDAFATLTGAHAGRPGAIVVAGTGSVGEALCEDGARLSVGGWGFPVGDEGSGAWLGQHAVQLAHWAVDGRLRGGPLVHAVWDVCGDTRDKLLTWCEAAGQFAYARLAPLVFEHEACDLAAAQLLQRAAQALDALALALDAGQRLPLAVCGSIGQRLAPRLSPACQTRRVEPAGNAVDGAIHLVRRALG
ncbi:ATPase [Verminephrobacter aporrectodeae subsp. tuberculatae]|uniref:ATPase n=1 Tax=Verminephrobacter aporrectodeae subsp. tuberculatae TaxID=1110392 RepID=A0ABT3KWI1_9BURK|nr:BadF/BadG/BcrA/BcrD ATPase family protein [Verminephrobacter aporrectodeae]MCW5322701.1 ATPase [Verminephrobacter aporrectodeae subsp. tuberculatae]